MPTILLILDSGYPNVLTTNVSCVQNNLYGNKLSRWLDNNSPRAIITFGNSYLQVNVFDFGITVELTVQGIVYIRP